MKQYKFMNEGLKSSYDNSKWKIGKKRKTKGSIGLCKNGFHSSKQPLDAITYISGEVLAIVKGEGQAMHGDDKSVFSEMTIIEAYHWKKEDSVALSIYCAELCIEEFERVYPNDNRPRDAIKAAKKWLKNPTKKNQDAIRSAESAAWSAARSAAWSAESAVRSVESTICSATRSAIRSAESAAWSATRSAARSAESAARSAARSAESAVRSVESAARSAVIKKVNTWIKRRINKLEKIK